MNEKPSRTITTCPNITGSSASKKCPRTKLNNAKEAKNYSDKYNERSTSIESP